MPRLTKKEKEVVTTVLDEFIAGHSAEDVRQMSFAETEEEGREFLARLSSALRKLTA